MSIRPVRTQEEYSAALSEIEALFDAPPGSPEADRLEVLTTLVEAYEEEHFPISAPDPIEAINYWLDTRGLTRRDLEPCIGSRARVSEVMNRKRPLSLSMIRKLEANLGIPANVLIQPYEAGTREIAPHGIPKADIHHALLLDTLTLEYESTALPSTYSLDLFTEALATRPKLYCFLLQTALGAISTSKDIPERVPLLETIVPHVGQVFFSARLGGPCAIASDKWSLYASGSTHKEEEIRCSMYGQ